MNLLEITVVVGICSSIAAGTIELAEEVENQYVIYQEVQKKNLQKVRMIATRKANHE